MFSGKNKKAKAGRRLQRKETRRGWLYVAPALLAFVIFMFWPLVYTFYLSFFKWNMVSPNKEFVGLKNYIDLLTSKTMGQLLFNTLLYVAILVVINFLVPYILAFVNHFVLKRFKNFYKIIFFMPSLISLVVGAMIIQWLFNPIIGPVAAVFDKLGLTMPTWSKTKGMVIFVISLVASYKAFGYNFLVLLSGVSNVSDELIEAARLENASSTQIFKHIVAPLTSSTSIYVLIMSIVQGIQYVYTPIAILTQGGPNNASSNIIYGTYQEAFLYYNSGRASVISVVAMILFVLLLLLEFKYVEKGVYYEN